MAEERKSQFISLDGLASSTTVKSEFPIAQFIDKIKSRIQVKLNSDERLLKLLSELEENSTLFVEELDLDITDKVALAEEGKRLSQELKQKISELSRNVAALLTSSVQGIENYYNQFLPVTTHYANQSRGLVDGKLGEMVSQEVTVTQAQSGYVEAKLERAQQTVSTISKKPGQSFFSVFKSEQYSQRDQLNDEETVKQKLANRIPKNFQLGAAIGQGDCFFDAMAQSLNALKGSKEYTAKSLRLLCDDYVKSGKYTWVKEAIEGDNDNYEQYLVRLPFTVEELEEEEKANTGLKLEDIVWGRPEIEGRMICESTKIKLHVIGVLAQSINGIEITEQVVDPQASEPIISIENGPYDSANMVHLVNYHNHFVPLLDTKLVQADTTLAQLAKDSHSPSHTNIPVTAPYSQNSFNTNATTTGKMQVEVKNRRTTVSMSSRLAKGEFADVIKEKIKQGVNANPHYKLLLELLVNPAYKEHEEFLKEQIRNTQSGTPSADAQAYLTWLEKNYDKIDHRAMSSKFEEEAIDLYIREEIEVQIKRWNVPNVPSHFIGRENLLEQLAQRLNPKENQTSTVILKALHGLGGVGKTFLAARYAQLYAETYNFIFWFNAENETTLTNDYRHFADAFHLPIEGQSPENILNIVKNWLEQQSNWLIIYDNAPDDKLIAKYRPANGGKVLITSRKESWSKKDSLPIDVFSLEEARAYIVELTGFALAEHQAMMDELAETLEYLPLALAQACAYISVNKLSLEDYLELYAESRAEMLADKTMPAETSHEPVAVTWNITFKAIQEQQPAASALLESCAFLQGSSIPEFLLKELFAKQQSALAKQEKPFTDAMGCLQQYSMLRFINQEKEEKLFSLHNLVQEVIIHALPSEEKQAYLIGIIHILQETYPYKDVEQLEDYAKQRVLLPHLEKVLERIEEWFAQLKKGQVLSGGFLSLEIEKELVAVILLLIARGYSNLGNSKQAKNLLERALMIEEQYYGKNNPEIASTLISLAIEIGNLGDARQQKYLLKRALAFQKQGNSKNHLEVAITLVNLASAYGNLGDFQKQKQLLEEALPIFEEQYEQNHFYIASTLANLANLSKNLGDNLQAKKLLKRTLMIEERYYDKNHPEIAITLNNLANVYGSLGKNKQKKQLLERALLIQEKHYGNDHPEVARTKQNLANAIGKLGNIEQKKQLLEQALVISKQHYGKNHIETASIQENLANAYIELNNVKQAKQLLKDALHIYEQHYGTQHSELIITLHNLAIVYEQSFQLGKAKKVLERAFEISLKDPNIGPQHPLASKAKNKLTTFISKWFPEQFFSFQSEHEYSVNEKNTINFAKELRNAANQNNVEKLKELLPKITNVNAKDPGSYGRSALHWAIIKQAIPCIKLLLTAGADAKIADNIGKSSFDYASENATSDALFLLLSHHYNLSLDNVDSGKLLRRAAHQNSSNDVKLLLKHIKNINEKDAGNSQRTALHWAVIQGATDCIEVLLMAGADPTLVDASGKTALDYAKENKQILELLKGNPLIAKMPQK